MEKEVNNSTKKMLMYFIVFSITMLFGGFISAYIVSSVGQLDSKIDDGFKDVLSKISDAHPHSALADRYRKRTAKEAKGKAALDRIKKKYGKITE